MGKILAVPVRMLAQLVGFLRVSDPLFLWSVTWKLSGQARDGSQLLLLICGKDGIEAAREAAEEMLEECRSAELAATMGWIELQRGGGDVQGRYDSAREWIERAKQGGFENQQMLLYLEHFISQGDSEKRGKVAEEILSRNDLPMEFTRAGLTDKAFGLAHLKDFSGAEAIADNILCIEENAEARLLKWMASLSRGNEAEAERHLLKSKEGGWPEVIFNYMVGQGFLLLGKKREAMEWLYKAKAGGFEFKENKSEIWALVNSSEFAEFCKEREG